MSRIIFLIEPRGSGFVAYVKVDGYIVAKQRCATEAAAWSWARQEAAKREKEMAR